MAVSAQDMLPGKAWQFARESRQEDKVTAGAPVLAGCMKGMHAAQSVVASGLLL
jgi:hypothetical protein